MVPWEEMAVITFDQVLSELTHLLIITKQIDKAQYDAYFARLYDIENPVTPQEMHDELVARFLEAQTPTPPNGNDPSGDGSNATSNGGPHMEESRMPVIIGFLAVASIAARLAPYVLRAGALVTIPVHYYRALPPPLRNAIVAAITGTGEFATNEWETEIGNLFAAGDENATVVEITGTPDQLAQLTQGGGGSMGLTVVPGLGNLPPGVWIVKSWRAPGPITNIDGVLFHKFSNGLIAVQKKDGTWKIYRPRKPIVLYAGVGNNRRSIMRAAHIVRAEVKQWKAMEKFFGMQRRRALPAPKRAKTVIVEHGSGSVIAD